MSTTTTTRTARSASARTAKATPAAPTTPKATSRKRQPKSGKRAGDVPEVDVEPTPAPKATKTPVACACGCGVTGSGTYRPGHDARHAGVVGRDLVALVQTPAFAEASDEDKATAFALRLQVLPTRALQDKAEGLVRTHNARVAKQAAAKVAREAAKAAAKAAYAQALADAQA